MILKLELHKTYKHSLFYAVHQPTSHQPSTNIQYQPHSAKPENASFPTAR